MAFHPYADPASVGGGILAGIFGLPLLVGLIATLLVVGRRRLGPVKRGFYVASVAVVVLFALDILFAHATFRGCC